MRHIDVHLFIAVFLGVIPEGRPVLLSLLEVLAKGPDINYSLGFVKTEGLGGTNWLEYTRASDVDVRNIAKILLGFCHQLLQV